MKIIALVVLLFCFHLPESTPPLSALLSCSGVGYGPPCREFGATDAVFIGTAVEVVAVPWVQSERPPWQQWQPYQKLTARLTVEEVFRGAVGQEITFEMDSCYYPFKQGEKYLIYANKGADGKLYQATDQSRTRPLTEAKEDLDYIRNISKMPAGGRIYGKVHNHVQQGTLNGLGAPSDHHATLPGVKIVAEGMGERYETTTDSTGSYEFTQLPEGLYKVRALVPSYLSGAEDLTKVFDRGCAPVSFSIQATGSIVGKVLDIKGQPIANLTVSIFSSEGVNEAVLEGLKPNYERRDTTDKEGQFRFSRLPSGKYYIVINLLKEYEKISPAYPRTFYPGVLKLSDADVITLQDGEQKQNITLKMPALPVSKQSDWSRKPQLIRQATD